MPIRYAGERCAAVKETERGTRVYPNSNISIPSARLPHRTPFEQRISLSLLFRLFHISSSHPHLPLPLSLSLFLLSV